MPDHQILRKISKPEEKKRIFSACITTLTPPIAHIEEFLHTFAPMVLPHAHDFTLPKYKLSSFNGELLTVNY